MGLCGSVAAESKGDRVVGGQNTQPNQPNNYDDGYDSYDDEPPPLTEAEIQSRIQKGSGTQTMSGDNYKLVYAWLSQRGYYPESLDKNNQDACKIIRHLDNDRNKAYFGVYDGHGHYGDLVSGFVRDQISWTMTETVKLPSVKHTEFDQKYSRVHEHINEECHKDPRFDDSSSGTTAISVYIEGTTVKVANLGDSRAVVAQRQPNGRLKSIALSQDQTPYRKDERERCKLEGARIMTMDQLEGLAPIHEDWGVNLGEEIDDGGDPPRIWAKDGRYPGTAFTRSIGDSLAESLGVYATPEVLTLELDSSHEFIVLASDGVWEFITSQSVVDMVAKFKDPLKACQTVVSEAYTLWLRHEVRTDDITMIVIHIKDLKKRVAEAKLSDAKRQSFVQRPVRRRPHRDVVQAGADTLAGAKFAKEDAEEYDIAANAVPKTAEELVRLRDSVRSNFLFVHLDDTQLSNIFSVMQKVVVSRGETIIKQGEDGNKFYVVDAGSFDVYVSAKESKKSTVVMTYEDQGSFGELALMYGKPRAATIVAKTDGVLWSLDRRAFRRLVMKSSAKSLMGTLKGVEVLKSLKQKDLVLLADALTEVTFKVGTYVITQGEVGDKFYVIQSGEVKCTVADGDKQKEVLRLGAGSYFGERALLSSKPRAANVIATKKLKCLQISRAAFEDILGPLSSIIEEDQKRRESRGRKITRKASVQYKGSQISDLSSSSHFDFQAIGTFFVDSGDFCDVAITRFRGREYNMRRFNKAKVQAKGLEESIIRAKNIMASRRKSNRYITDLLATYVDENCLWMLTGSAPDIMPPICMHLSELLMQAEGGQVLRESHALFYAACIGRALENLHASQIVFRNIDINSIGIDQAGFPILYDFLMAKDLANDPRTSTLCGAKAYFSPEQVSSANGHSYPVDLWSMGVLIYELMSGSTPFECSPAAGGEKGMYDRIIAHRSGSITMDGAGSDCVNFVNKLLHHNEKKRMQASQISKHAWFKSTNLGSAPIDWNQVDRGTIQAPFLDVVAMNNEAVYKGKMGAGQSNSSRGRSKVASIPYIGDPEWFENF